MVRKQFNEQRKLKESNVTRGTVICSLEFCKTNTLFIYLSLNNEIKQTYKIHNMFALVRVIINSVLR